MKRASLFGLAVLGCLLLGTPRADAHAVLLETTPVDGAVVDGAPRQVTLRYDEAVTLIPRSIQLSDAGGDPVRIGAPHHLAGKASTVAADLTPGLSDGTYVVSWRVVSSDSHVISGAFQFSIGAPSPVVSAARPQASRVAPAVNTVAGAVAFLGMTVAVGGAVFLGVLWPGGRPPRTGRVVVWAGFAALALGTVAVLLVQYPYTTGGAITSAFSAHAIGTTLGTRLGHAALARLAVTLVLAATFALLVRWRGRDPARRRVLGVVGVLGALALPLTWTLDDHAHTGMQVWLAVPVTSVHLLAIALWLGGLIALVACVIATARSRDAAGAGSVARVLPRFSGLALPCFAAIVATGLYQSWRQVGTLPALGATDFGRLLLVKLGGVVAIMLLAWQARRFVRRRQHLPGSGGEAAQWRWMRRSIAVEAVLGVAVLSVATVMGNTAPARTSYAPPVHAKVAFPAADQRLGGGHADVRLRPAKQGLNVADIYLVARDGTLLDVRDVTAQLAPGRRGGSAAQALDVEPAEPGHYVASTVSILYAGAWVLQLYVRTSDFDSTPLLVRFTAH